MTGTTQTTPLTADEKPISYASLDDAIADGLTQTLAQQACYNFFCQPGKHIRGKISCGCGAITGCMSGLVGYICCGICGISAAGAAIPTTACCYYITDICDDKYKYPITSNKPISNLAMCRN